VTIAGSVAIGRDRLRRLQARHGGGLRGAGIVGGDRRDEAAVQHGAQRVADQRVRSSEAVDEAVPGGRGGEDGGDVDEQPAARLGHRPRGRELPDREPERRHRVGEHLLVADRDVDAVAVIGGGGQREQGRDRPALDDLEAGVVETPLDVLRPAEPRLDVAAELRERTGLVIGEQRSGPGRGGGPHLLTAHGVGVRHGPPRDEPIAETGHRLHPRDRAVAAGGVGREQDPGHARRDHALDDHGHPHPAFVAAVPPPVGDRALRHQ
jgi:hypothetical protein